jgi:hypothetical protein
LKVGKSSISPVKEKRHKKWYKVIYLLYTQGLPSEISHNVHNCNQWYTSAVKDVHNLHNSFQPVNSICCC